MENIKVIDNFLEPDELTIVTRILSEKAWKLEVEIGAALAVLPVLLAGEKSEALHQVAIAPLTDRLVAQGGRGHRRSIAAAYV